MKKVLITVIGIFTFLSFAFFSKEEDANREVYLPTIFPVTEAATMLPVAEDTIVFVTPTTGAVVFQIEALSADTLASLGVLSLSPEEIKFVSSVIEEDNNGVEVYKGELPMEGMSDTFGPPCTKGMSFHSSGGYTFSLDPRYHPGYDGYCTDDMVGASAAGIVYKYYPYLSPSEAESEIYWSSGTTYILVHNIKGLICYTVYGHLKEGFLGAGDPVSAGDQLGIMGTTGLSTGNHIHFGIACEVNGPGTLKWFDPTSFEIFNPLQ